MTRASGDSDIGPAARLLEPVRTMCAVPIFSCAAEEERGGFASNGGGVRGGGFKGRQTLISYNYYE